MFTSDLLQVFKETPIPSLSLHANGLRLAVAGTAHQVQVWTRVTDTSR